MEFVRAVFDTGCAAVTVDRDAVNWGSQKKRESCREKERGGVSLVFLGFFIDMKILSCLRGRVLQL